jgi:hypothetical protein
MMTAYFAISDVESYFIVGVILLQARLQRANVRLKQGKLDEARKDYEDVVSIRVLLI